MSKNTIQKKASGTKPTVNEDQLINKDKPEDKTNATKLQDRLLKYSKLSQVQTSDGKVLYLPSTLVSKELTDKSIRNLFNWYLTEILESRSTERIDRYKEYHFMDRNCLTGDTKIKLVSGESVAIEDLVGIDDFFVYSYDLVSNKVVMGRGHTARKTGVNEKVYAITLDNGEVIRATNHHPWLMKDKAYKRTDELVVGSFLQSDSGFDCYVDSITDAGEEDVYDIIVDNYHNFALDAGVFVHNSSEISMSLDTYCFTGDTKISLLLGEEALIKDLVGREEFFVYSYDIENKKVVAGRGSNCRKTKVKTQTLTVTLDNGEKIQCTPDHKFLLRDGQYVEAKDLKVDQSLMPCYRKVTGSSCYLKGYEKVYSPDADEWIYTHWLADNYNGADTKFNGKYVKHHIDFNKRNNDPSNLKRMTFKEHTKFHNDNIKRTIHDRPEVMAKIKEYQKEKFIYLNKNDAEWNRKRLKGSVKGRIARLYKFMVESSLDPHDWDNSLEQIKNSVIPTNRFKYATVKKYFKRIIEIEVYSRHLSDNSEYNCIDFNAKRSEIMKATHADPAGRKKYIAALDGIRERSTGAYSKNMTRLNSNPEFNKAKSIGRLYKLCRLMVEHKLDPLDWDASLSTLKDKSIISKQNHPGNPLKYFESLEDLYVGSATRYQVAVNHKVKSVEAGGLEDVYDFEVEQHHNFALTAGVFVHNCDETVQLGKVSNGIVAYSKDPSLKREINNLLNKLKLNNVTYLRDLARNLAKYGDKPYGIEVTAKGVEAIEPVSVFNFERIEKYIKIEDEKVEMYDPENKYQKMMNDKFDNDLYDSPEDMFKVADYKPYLLGFKMYDKLVPPWNCCHFRLYSSEEDFFPYGRSTIEGVRAVYRHLISDEILMSLVRATKFNKLNYKLKINKPMDDQFLLWKTINEYRQNYNDHVVGESTRHRNASMVTDVWTVETENAGLTVETLNTEIKYDNIDDIEYRRDKLYTGLRLPRDYLLASSSSEIHGDTLIQQDLKFARLIYMLQSAILSGVVRIIQIHLVVTGREKDINNFSLSLPYPVPSYNLIELENQSKRLEHVAEFSKLLTDTMGIEQLPLKTIRRLLVDMAHMNEDLINKILKDIQEDLIEKKEAEGKDSEGGLSDTALELPDLGSEPASTEGVETEVKSDSTPTEAVDARFEKIKDKLEEDLDKKNSSMVYEEWEDGARHHMRANESVMSDDIVISSNEAASKYSTLLESYDSAKGITVDKTMIKGSDLMSETMFDKDNDEPPKKLDESSKK